MPYKKGVSWGVWHQTVSDGKAPLLETWEVWSTFLLPLPSGPPESDVAVPVKVTFIGQMLMNYSYLIEILEKKLLSNNNTKNVNMNGQINPVINSYFISMVIL